MLFTYKNQIMKKIFFVTLVGCIVIMSSCSNHSTSKLNNEKCSFYLAYEYAYKPDDIRSLDGIPEIFGFSVKGDDKTGKQLVLVYADGTKEVLDVSLIFTTSMLKDSPEILASLSEKSQYLIANSSDDDDAITILLDGGDFITVDVDNKECIYRKGDTLIIYPLDYRRLLIKGMDLLYNKQ